MCGVELSYSLVYFQSIYRVFQFCVGDQSDYPSVFDCTLNCHIVLYCIHSNKKNTRIWWGSLYVFDSAVLRGLSTVLDFYLAWYSSLSPSASVSSVFIVLYRYFKKIFLTSFSLPFSELSLVRLALDLAD